MGLTSSLSSALSGMHGSQKGLQVLSRNVANAGTPGYHRQSVDVVDQYGVTGSYVRHSETQRAFVQSVQLHFNREVADKSLADVRATYLERLEMFMGKPGTASSLDTVFGELEKSLQKLSTSPDDYSTRATVVTRAQAMAQGLNRLSHEVQGLRVEVEGELAHGVAELNRMLTSLSDINVRLADQGDNADSRAALGDERDRLVSGISELVDVKADYRSDGTVALMTRSGLGLLDSKPSRFSFENVGSLSANSLFDINDAASDVGKLMVQTPAGNFIDVVKHDVIQSGRLGGLIALRDEILPETQGQMDEVAAALAQAFSSYERGGAAYPSGPVPPGTPRGYELDLTGLRPGNEVSLSYSHGTITRNLRIVSVENETSPPASHPGPNGETVLQVDFSDMAGAAAAVQGFINAGVSPAPIPVTASGTSLRIVDDGAGNTTEVHSLSARLTADGDQTGLAFNLFRDGGSPFTNSLDGEPQKRGFASRITVPSAIISNNKLLVQYQPGGSLGDAARADHVLRQLQTMSFSSDRVTAPETENFRLSGPAGSLINQTLNYHGDIITAAKNDQTTRELTLEALNQRMDAEYGVNVDEEMARLMELQNAYSASARVVSVVQELIDTLMNI